MLGHNNEQDGNENNYINNNINDSQNNINNITLINNENENNINERSDNNNDDININQNNSINNNMNNENNNNTLNNLPAVNILSGLLPQVVEQEDSIIFDSFNNIDERRNKLVNNLLEYRLNKVDKLEKTNKKCVICLEDFNIDDNIISLPCINTYHNERIKKLL